MILQYNIDIPLTIWVLNNIFDDTACLSGIQFYWTQELSALES